MKKVVMFAMLFACAGAESLEDDVTDIGSAEQAFRGLETPNYQFGTQTGSSRMRCGKTNGGQVCAIPSKKVLSYCIDTLNSFGDPFPRFTAAQANLISTIIETFDNVENNIALDPETLFPDCRQSGSWDIVFQVGPVGASGTGSSDVNDYGKITSFGTLTNLTEGAGVVGSYQSWSKCTVQVDVTDINAKGSNQTQRDTGIKKAAAHAFYGCLGLGGRTDVTNISATEQSFVLTQTLKGLTSGEQCSIHAFSTVDSGQYNLNGADCASD